MCYFASPTTISDLKISNCKGSSDSTYQINVEKWTYEVAEKGNTEVKNLILIFTANKYLLQVLFSVSLIFCNDLCRPPAGSRFFVR